MTETLVICIGAQKAGTTWLSDYMRSRPDVHAPPVKEVHYFDARYLPKWCAKYEAEMLAEFQREISGLTLETCGDPKIQQKLAAMLLRFRMIADPREYMRFMNWGRRSARILFEATPDYAMLDRRGFGAMKSMTPDVRLILLLRNPADRFWSSLRFNKTHRPDFDIETMFDRLLEREDFLLQANYGRTIAEARAAVGPERLHVEFYERLFTPEAIGSICRYCGLDYVKPDFGARANSSMSIDMPLELRKRAVNAYARFYRDVEGLLPDSLPSTWRADLDFLEQRRTG